MTPTGEHPDDPATVDVAASSAPHRRRWWRWGKRAKRQLITDAAHSPEQNLRSRERVYMALQLVRFPFIVLSILAAWYLDNWWLAGVLFVVSVPLPWIAVMIGNGQGEKRDTRARNVYKPAVARERQRLEFEARRQQELGPTSGRREGGDSPTIIEHCD